MLPDNWRITCENNTGVQIDAGKIVVKWRGKYVDATTGDLVYGSESADIGNQSANLASNGFVNGTTVDNGGQANPFVEADVSVAVSLATNTATPDGNVIVYLDRATADVPSFPDNGNGEEIAIINFANAKADRAVVRTIN